MKPASEASPDPFALVGTTLGYTYLIEGVLGSGAHGALYAARHLRLQCRCAVKLLRLSPGPHYDALLATVGGSVNVTHPHLSVPFDLMPLADGSLLLCSPLLEGEDLATRVGLRGKLTLTEGLLVARQAAAALLALHRRGLAHGNLTAHNLFLVRYDDVAIDDALGESKGAEAVRLMDMGLGHCDGVDATTADDQRQLALLLLTHVADLTLQQRRVLERAQAALPQVRFPSMQEFWQALDGDSQPASRATKLVANRQSPGAASTKTALVPRKGRRPDRAPPAEEGARGPGADRLRRILLIGLVALLAIVGGVTGALMWRRAQVPMDRQAGKAPGDPLAADRAPEAETPAESTVTLRFALSPPEAEVLVDGRPVPMGNQLRVPRQGVSLPILARAPGHLPYQGTVVPDKDRTVDIALLPAETEDPQGPVKDRGKKRRHHRQKEAP